MIYMISLEDSRLFVATKDNLPSVKADLLKYCSEDSMCVDGPYDFVEIRNRLGYDPQNL